MPAPPISRIYDLLMSAFGPRGWWPAETDLEMMVGAILTQNTAWTQVEKAMARLRGAGGLSFRRLHRAPLEEVAAWIRPAGYFNVKARRLRALTTMVAVQYQGRVQDLLDEPPERLRSVLLAVNGVGPETADSILLYAGRYPVFVVDAYTRRFLRRHGWIEGGEPYDEVAALFTRALPSDTPRFNEYHALIVEVGKNHCRARPDCASCPLRSLLPRAGPVGDRTAPG